MKKFFLCIIIVLPVITLLSCKKSIDNQKENYVLGVMTKGVWFLENYVEDGVDVTDQFKDYVFQFHESGKLDATKNTVVQSGYWSGDINNLTLTVNFPLSVQVLPKLNYVWKWLDAHIGLVFAETVTASGKKITIRLRRK